MSRETKKKIAFHSSLIHSGIKFNHKSTLKLEFQSLYKMDNATFGRAYVFDWFTISIDVMLPFQHENEKIYIE